MRNHIIGENREQIQMLPPRIEEYVGASNPVRVIDAYVDSLDLSKLGFKKADLADVGRLPYHPGILLKLYIYGYFYGMRSSRKLEMETNRNLEVMWLLRNLRPDDKTICNFRSENAKAIRGVFVEFRVLCQNLELYGNETEAIDGTKIKASNSKKRNFTKDKLKERIEAIEQDVQKYLSSLDINDRQEMKLRKADVEGIKEKIKSLAEKLSEYRRFYAEMERDGETQVSRTDPDSRRMHSSQGTSNVGYNVQVAVDAKHKLISEYAATNEPTDMGQLHFMAVKTKEALGVSSLEVLADSGYANPSEIKKCDEEMITTFVPPREAGFALKNGVPREEYQIDKFIYNKREDSYTCPQGNKLVAISQRTNQQGFVEKRYATETCATCEARSFCTTNQRGRIITRSELHDTMDALKKRLDEHPEKTTLRGQLCEHVFGTIKTSMGLGSFLLRGILKVDAEFGFSALAYNMKRSINILSVPVLLKAIQDTS